MQFETINPRSCRVWSAGFYRSWMWTCKRTW